DRLIWRCLALNNSEVLVSLDIGTSYIKVIIGEVLNDSLNIIGVGEAKSTGMKKGAIVDIDQTVQSIHNAVEQAEHMVGMEIKTVRVGITGNHMQLQPCHGVVAVQSANRQSNEEDVARGTGAAKVISIPRVRAIMYVFANRLFVDGLDDSSDPRGMLVVRLEMEG